MHDSFTAMDIILICGNYNAGKSVLAHKYFRKRMRINRNEIRRSLKEMLTHGQPWIPGDFDESLEQLVQHTEMSLLQYLMQQNEKIVIDNTSISKSKRWPYIREARSQRKTIGCIYIDVSLETVLSRNRRRTPEERMPEQVLLGLDAGAQPPTEEEGFDLIKIIEQ